MGWKLCLGVLIGTVSFAREFSRGAVNVNGKHGALYCDQPAASLCLLRGTQSAQMCESHLVGMVTWALGTVI